MGKSLRSSACAFLLQVKTIFLNSLYVQPEKERTAASEVHTISLKEINFFFFFFFLSLPF